MTGNERKAKRLAGIAASREALKAADIDIERVHDLCLSGGAGGLNRRPEHVEERTGYARRLRGLGLSYPKIARALGYESHAAVIAMLKRSEVRA